jgi:hypothetical protein
VLSSISSPLKDEGEAIVRSLVGRVDNVRRGGAGNLYHLKFGFFEKNTSLYCEREGTRESSQEIENQCFVPVVSAKGAKRVYVRNKWITFMSMA